MAQNQKAAKIDRQQTQHLKDGHADTVVGPMCPNSANIWEDVCQMWEDRPLQEGVQEQDGLCSA